MHSSTFLKNRFSLAILVAVFLFILFNLKTDGSKRLALATGLLNDWKLVEAQGMLSSLVEEDPSSLEVRRLYAECLLKRGELADASREFLFLKDTDSIRWAEHTLSLSLVHYYRGRLDSAAFLANEIFREPIAQTHTPLLARASHLLGRIAFDEARYDSALTLQRQSLAYAVSSGSLQTEADAMRQIGVIYWYSGQSDSARVSYYEPALRVYRKLGDKIGEATTLNNIALITADPRYYLKAFAIRRSIGDKIGLADSYYFITYAITGHWQDVAFAFHKKAFELSSTIGYAWGKEVAARAIEHLVFVSHDSLHLLPLMADTSYTLSPEGRILQLQLRSSDYLRRGMLKECADLRERLVRMCDSLGYTQGLPTALAQQVVALIPLGQYDEAERVATRLVQYASWDGRVALARVYIASGRFAEASRVLLSLLDALDQEYLGQLNKNDVRFSVRAPLMLSQRYALFSLLMQSLSRQHDHAALLGALERFRSLPLGFGIEPPGATGEESIWHRYISTVEKIDEGSDDIQKVMDEFEKEYDLAEQHHSTSVRASEQLVDHSNPTIQELQRALAPDQILLEYFLGTDSAYVLAIRQNKSMFARLHTPVNDLNSSARAYLDLVLRERTSQGDTLWRGPARFLFSSLFQPVIRQGMARDGDHLIISPHAILHYVPFPALLDGSGRFAVERFTLSSTPSASRLLSGRPQPSSSTLLALAPDTKSLPFARREVASIPEALSSHQVLLFDERATTDELLRNAPVSDLIHLAAHGRTHRWHPLFSSLEFADGPLELYRVLGIALSARLVVVSACETGYGVGMLGDVTSGHAAVSFQQAFLSAGASAVVAPLWIVEDESTSRLLELFYSHLAEQKPDGHMAPARFAEALTVAQRQFVQEARSNGSKGHPFYWAGFFLMGNPN
jgi:CHAT domain-containing protein